MSTINLYTGDSLEVLKQLPENSIDSICTDAPYGLSFMGKKWDYEVPSVEIWKQALRVLKPGGHLLCFGGTRTYHRLVVNIEDAGFEIRDQIQWLYGSGFPKSTDVSKRIDKEAGATREVIGFDKTCRLASNKNLNDDNWEKIGTQGAPITKAKSEDAIKYQGWGSALKPANEPICVARKPLEKGLTLAQNVLKYGTGAINIDESRIDYTSEADKASATPQGKVTSKKPADGYAKAAGIESERHEIERPELKGRWPANIILDEVAAEMLDEQSIAGGIHSAGKPRAPGTAKQTKTGEDAASWDCGHSPNNGVRLDDGGKVGASRFFYVAKASKKDRNTNGAVNNHSTVKPTKLMEYLIRLVTPAGGTTLDPFMGSGSTGVAAKNLGFNFVGIELNEEYTTIAEKRIGVANELK